MSEIFGHVDHFVGSYLNGWATVQPSEGPCVVEIIDDTGAVVGSGLACERRDDLASLNFGRCDFAFRIPVSFGDGTHLRARVDGVELLGSPIPIGATLFDGHFNIDQGMAVGWVSRRSDLQEPVRISVRLADGTEVGEGFALPDTTDADPFVRPCRFEIPLHAICIGRREFVVTGYVEGVPFHSTVGRLPVDGYVDIITPDYCCGWLLCPEAPQRTITITAYRDGEAVGTAVCDMPRYDLRSKYPGSWQCGFDLRFDPPDVSLSSLSELSFRVEGSRLDLLGGPYLVGRRAGFVAVGKQVASLAHQAGTGLGRPERALLQDILRTYLHGRRHGEDYAWVAGLTAGTLAPRRPITILVPIYKGVEITEACIRSVISTFGPHDCLLLVADAPPQPEMHAMLDRFQRQDRVVVLRNQTNLGFIGAVNRGLEFCPEGDVLLLNSDTRLFPGGIEELRRVLHSDPSIATVTAMSNNATIFSYPHPTLPSEALGDASWEELAQVALQANRGQTVDVPTGHGFCLLLRREVLDRLGSLNTAFGRGYGEENEFCMRATDLGFRHVAAAGVLVEHRESVSFGDEKLALLGTNLQILDTMYPEYTAVIMGFERTDPLRASRWALDSYRLAKTRQSGVRFVLSVENWLGGGTGRAVRDIGEIVGYGDRWLMRLSSLENGLIQLSCEALRLKAVFAGDEHDALVALLSAANVDLVLFHQVLGFHEGMIRALGRWAGSRRSIFYVHDFYSICPRTTLINAVESYCGVAEASVCRRCLKLGGAHEASRLNGLSPEQHRQLFLELFAHMSTLISPSEDTAMHLRRVFPDLDIRAVPHPTRPGTYPAQASGGSRQNIVVLGAIGPHKGSRKLLELASQALLTHAHLTFTVVGHTDIDAELKKLGNVTIRGRYKPQEVTSILRDVGSGVALFLNCWPETFSYTLSEAVQSGLLPVVPDIGAPAERVRNAGFGVVYPFPFEAGQVLEVLDRLGDMQERQASPSSFDLSASSTDLRAVMV